MTLSKKTERIIWVAAGGRCSLCKELLLHTGVESTTFLGEVAHIVAEKPEGPRGDVMESLRLADDPKNLLLLCPTCHEKVDKFPDLFTIETLTEKKRLHEEWVTRTLSNAPQWFPGKIQPAYIHVPRLAILAAQAGITFTPRLGERGDLHSLGFELNHVMLEVEGILNVIKPNAVGLDKITNPSDDEYVGALVSMENTPFRTKNCDFSKKENIGDSAVTWEKSPHIYRATDDFTLVLSIDRKWITTSSAFTWFRNGQWRFAGLFMITNIDHDQKIIFGTPLFIGTESIF